jgi:hypothetical protein
MKIHYNFSGTGSDEFYKEHLDRLIPLAIARYGPRITRAQVSVEDVNGPKGGIDKTCRCVLHLKRMQPVVVEERGEQLGSTMKRLADRVSYTLSQRFSRQVKRVRRAKPAKAAGGFRTSSLS